MHQAAQSNRHDHGSGTHG